jgi:hypothetical protein
VCSSVGASVDETGPTEGWELLSILGTLIPNAVFILYPAPKGKREEIREFMEFSNCGSERREGLVSYTWAPLSVNFQFEVFSGHSGPHRPTLSLTFVDKFLALSQRWDRVPPRSRRSSREGNSG